MSEREQLSLLDWAPVSPSVQFDERLVRSNTLAGRICRAVSATLTECQIDRQEIAARMSRFLGSQVGLNALNGYASPAREDRMISLMRFIALLAVSRDRRLLELVAEPLGWTVIERRHLPVIQLAEIREKRRELTQLERRLARRLDVKKAA